jgi:hypothetical protein
MPIMPVGHMRKYFMCIHFRSPLLIFLFNVDLTYQIILYVEAHGISLLDMYIAFRIYTNRFEKYYLIHS